MEKKEAIKDMRELRRKELEKGNKSSSTNYLGTIHARENIDGVDQDLLKEVFMVLEMFEKNGHKMEVKKYFTKNFESGDFELLGGDIVGDGIHSITLDKNSKYSLDQKLKKEIEDQLNTLAEKDGLNLEREELKELEEVAKALGIDTKDIEEISELDPEQEIEKEKDDKEKSKDDDNNDKNKNGKDENDKEDLDKKETEKLTKLTGKQDININAKYNTRNSLRETLGLSSEFTTVRVVSSDRLKDVKKDAKGQSSTFALVGIRNDGTAQELTDILQLDTAQGAMPNRTAKTIRPDGTMVETNNTLARFRIRNGKTEGNSLDEYIGISRGAYGEIEVKTGYKTKEENEVVEFPVETSTIRPISRKIRELQRPGKGEYNIDAMQNEADEHFRSGDQRLTNIKDYDGKEGGSHAHSEEEKGKEKYGEDGNEEIAVTVNIEEKSDEWAELLLQNEEIDINFTKREVKDMIEKQWKNDIGDSSVTESQIHEELKKIEGNIEGERTHSMGAGH